MKNSLLLAATAIIAILVGCATGPNFKTYRETVPPIKNGEGRLWFYRPRMLFGTAPEPRVYLNGVSVGRAVTSTFFYVDEPPGRYEVQCGKERIDKAYLTVSKNHVQFVRLVGLPSAMLGLMSANMQPEAVSEAEGLKEIEECVFIGEKQLRANSGIPLEKPKEK